MGLFGKKKQETNCCCADNCSEENMAAAENDKNAGARVKILGGGCAKCNELEENARVAMAQMGMYEPVDHVTDFVQIASYGVMTTPALVIDGKVVSLGKVLSVEEVKQYL